MIRAVALLRRLEWSKVTWRIGGYDGEESEHSCPVCGGVREHGHQNGCELLAVLAEFERMDSAAAIGRVAVLDKVVTMTELTSDEREHLGNMVREEWLKWAREQPNQNPLVPWSKLSEEVARLIGERLYTVGTWVAADDIARLTSERDAAVKKAEADVSEAHNERDAAIAEVEQLKRLLTAEPEAVALHFEDGNLDVGFKSTAAAQIFAEAFRQTLDNHEADNYLEVSLTHATTGNRYVVTIHRPGGKTAHELRRKTERERDAALETIDRLTSERDAAVARLSAARELLTTVVDEAVARAEAAEREADRWRHGVPIEGDYVCPAEADQFAPTLSVPNANAKEMSLLCVGCGQTIVAPHRWRDCAEYLLPRQAAFEADVIRQLDYASREMIVNGKSLSALGGEHEGRQRVLVGLLIAEVAQGIHLHRVLAEIRKQFGIKVDDQSPVKTDP